MESDKTLIPYNIREKSLSLFFASYWIIMNWYSKENYRIIVYIDEI